MVVEKDNFKFFTGKNEKSPLRLIFDSSKKDETLQYINLKSVSHLAFGLGLSSEDDLSFLIDFPSIEFILYNSNPKIDFSFVNNMKNLKELYTTAKIDFEITNPKLEKLNFDWSCKTKFSARCKSLKELEVHKCKDFPSFSAQLTNLPNLNSLSLVQGNSENMRWVPTCLNIMKLKLFYFPKLASLEGIERLENLEELELNTGRKITDYSPIGMLPKLKRLVISNHSEISDLSFLVMLKNLRTLVISETKITAKNLSYLNNIKEVNLWKTGFDNYKNN